MKAVVNAANAAYFKYLFYFKCIPNISIESLGFPKATRMFGSTF